MSVDRWIGVAGLLLAGVGLLLTWRLRNPAPHLIAHVRTTRLRMNRPLEDLAISWRGNQVQKPLLVEFLVWNPGRVDIPVSAFEGGQAIVRVPNTKLLDLSSEGATRGVLAHPVDDGVEFELPPQLLKGGEGARAVAICDGDPGETQYQLRLTNVVTGRSPSSILWRRALARSLAMMLVVSGVITVAVLTSKEGGSSVEPLPLFVAFMLAVTAFGTFLGAMGLRVAESVADETLAVQKIDFGSPL